MDKLLKIEGFSLFLNSGSSLICILDHINLDIEEGSITSLVGVSGSGKTMLAKSILSLFEMLPEPHTEGRIMFKREGEFINLLDANKSELQEIRNKEIGIVFQQSKEAFNPAFKIGTQILEKLLIHSREGGSDRKEDVLQIFKEVDLIPEERFYNAFPHQLSGGQIQRCLIALALINNPVFLIADEPSSALDQDLKIDLMKLLKRINRERNLTILLISHDLKLVSAISDRIALIEAGGIIETGLTQDIISAPKSVQAKAFMACIPPKALKMKSLATINDFVEHPDLSVNAFIDRQAIPEADINLRLQNLESRPVLLEVSNLTKQFHATNNLWKKNTAIIQVFENLSFNIRENEIFGLLGPSGSGKSTVAKIIGGLVKPEKGEIIFENQNLNNFSEQDIISHQKKCQIIFQDPMSAMAPHIKVNELLAEALMVNELEPNRQNILLNLQSVGLSEAFLEKLPRQMSGGERQRVLIARALIFKPRLLICDEILSALDVSSQAQIINLLIELNREHNITILFISHDEPMINFISDRKLRLSP